MPLADARSLARSIATWDFAQAFIRAWQSDFPTSPTKDDWGTLIVTGATMSLRGSANFSAMAPGAWSRRALTQSLAREFGPKGLHVAHAIIDGVILTERTKVIAGAPGEDGTRLLPEDIAAAYVDLVKQRPSAWTAELDLRWVWVGVELTAGRTRRSGRLCRVAETLVSRVRRTQDRKCNAECDRSYYNLRLWRRRRSLAKEQQPLLLKLAILDASQQIRPNSGDELARHASAGG